MKTAETKLIKLDFNEALKELREEEQAIEIIAKFENDHGKLNDQLITRLLSETKKLYLSFNYHLPKGIDMESAKTFIRIWLTIPNSVVVPIQNNGLSLRLNTFRKNEEINEEVPFESLSATKLPQYFKMHLGQLLHIINEVGTEKLTDYLKDNVEQFNSNQLIECVRSQNLIQKGYTVIRTSELLGLEENVVLNYKAALEEQKNPMPCREIMLQKINRIQFLKEEVSKNACLRKAIELFEQVTSGEVKPDIASNLLQQMWQPNQVLSSVEFHKN